jgi:hypothetical protein
LPKFSYPFNNYFSMKSPPPRLSCLLISANRFNSPK